MTVREILKMGDPRLLRVAQPARGFGKERLLGGEGALVSLRGILHGPAAGGAGHEPSQPETRKHGHEHRSHKNHIGIH